MQLVLRAREVDPQFAFCILSRLRMAKDKAEFDQSMAERRTRSEQPPQPQV
jgi:hypothetical protein